jgi:hypothetical protein
MKSAIVLGCLSGMFVAIGVACGAFQQAKPVIDINSLELACVESASTREASRDCRNAVRRAWAKANGIVIVDLVNDSGDVQ